MKLRLLRHYAALFGNRAVALIGFNAHPDVVQIAARRAAHSAIEYLDTERMVNAPAKTLIDNRMLAAQRQANTPRCAYRRVYMEKGVIVAGDPCGGKLAVKKHAGRLIAIECRVCGRRPAPTPIEEVFPEAAIFDETAPFRMTPMQEAA